MKLIKNYLEKNDSASHTEHISSFHGKSWLLWAFHTSLPKPPLFLIRRADLATFRIVLTQQPYPELTRFAVQKFSSSVSFGQERLELRVLLPTAPIQKAACKLLNNIIKFET
ncbi:hypothetical protein CEXT_408421 [Caerostris extrusa]|uniref:LAGLIDADG homing endonuclease n=1 Tax=Caerostris extrusa TaxID=172846 RepID=A0AAV4SEA2_CAEEX|nr:hypothetical protein CEXT_408421 [Caerostris extrusa]